MFLEEPKSISKLNIGLSEKRSKGRPEGRGMEEGEMEESIFLVNTFAKLFLCIFHVRIRAKDERGEGRGKWTTTRSAHLHICTSAYLHRESNRLPT